jgi:hypothetical protein
MQPSQVPSDTRRNALLEPEDSGGEDELDDDVEIDEDELMDGKVSYLKLVPRAGGLEFA